MVLTPTDRLVVRWSALRWCLQEGVHAVANATSHGDVVSGLNGILTTMATIPSTECAELLNNLNWTTVLDRCVCVWGWGWGGGGVCVCVGGCMCVCMWVAFVYCIYVSFTFNMNVLHFQCIFVGDN